MRPIPSKMRAELDEDPFYHQCCVSHLSDCEGRIEWNHHLIFAGRQVNAKFCILPMCSFHHRNVNRPIIKNELDRIMLSRATPEELAKYSKAIDYKKVRDRLL